MWIDGRIPVRFAARRAAQPAADALLVIADEGESIGQDNGGQEERGHEADSGWGKIVRLALPRGAPHGPGCACCGPRSPDVAALGALFQARARGEIVFFRAVVVDLPPEHAAGLRGRLVSDSYLSACFVETREG